MSGPARFFIRCNTRRIYLQPAAWVGDVCVRNDLDEQCEVCGEPLSETAVLCGDQDGLQAGALGPDSEGACVICEEHHGGCGADYAVEVAAPAPARCCRGECSGEPLGVEVQP